MKNKIAIIGLGYVGPLKSGGVFIDIKSAYLPEAITAAGACLWRL
jgi:hypothetical protein